MVGATNSTSLSHWRPNNNQLFRCASGNPSCRQCFNYLRHICSVRTSTSFQALLQQFLRTCRLWADVTNCPSPSCSCTVQRDDITSESYPIAFLPDRLNRGSVDIRNLNPDTSYSFTLSCLGTTQTVTRPIRTDYGRPSGPQNITARLIGQRLRVSWLRPAVPAGPIHSYRFTVDPSPLFTNLSGDALFFDNTEDYVSGTAQTFIIQACNTNKRNVTECSLPNEGRVSFSSSTSPVSVSTPSSGSTPRTTPRSEATGVFSNSVFLIPFLYSSFVLIQWNRVNEVSVVFLASRQMQYFLSNRHRSLRSDRSDW